MLLLCIVNSLNVNCSFAWRHEILANQLLADRLAMTSYLVRAQLINVMYASGFEWGPSLASIFDKFGPSWGIFAVEIGLWEQVWED